MRILFTCSYCGWYCPGIGPGSCYERMERSVQIFQSILPKTTVGPKIIIESTAAGMGNHLYESWQRAQSSPE